MDDISNKHNMKEVITIKDLEDCIREIMFNNKKVVKDKHYIYEINGNSIEITVKTKRCKRKGLGGN